METKTHNYKFKYKFDFQEFKERGKEIFNNMPKRKPKKKKRPY